MDYTTTQYKCIGDRRIIQGFTPISSPQWAKSLRGYLIIYSKTTSLDILLYMQVELI